MMGTLGQMAAGTLDIYCATKIDTTVAVVLGNIVVHPNGGALSLTQSVGALSVSGNATFTGDSLYSVGALINVGGNTTLAGAKVNVNGGIVVMQNNATFQAAQATYNGVTVSVGGTASFGGGTTGTQLFSGGLLNLSGPFDQQPGASLATFTTSNDHVTWFTGTLTQSISFVNSQSFFSILRLQNSNPGGVVVLNSAQNINGTIQPRIDLVSGRLVLNPGTTFSASGGMSLGLSTNLDLGAGSNFQLTSGACSGRTTNGATITGTGNFNGAPYTASTCTP
jgi:hypothetical protein